MRASEKQDVDFGAAQRQVTFLFGVLPRLDVFTSALEYGLAQDGDTLIGNALRSPPTWSPCSDPTTRYVIGCFVSVATSAISRWTSDSALALGNQHAVGGYDDQVVDRERRAWWDRSARREKTLSASFLIRGKSRA